MKLDEYELSLSYKSTLIKIGDLRNVYKTLRKSLIGHYADHIKKGPDAHLAIYAPLEEKEGSILEIQFKEMLIMSKDAYIIPPFQE